MNELELETVTFYDYKIREDGLVIGKYGRPIKHNIVVNRNGRHYPKYHLMIDGKRELWFAHRLMAWVFLAMGVISLEEFKKTVVDHLDNDPMNYAVWNLEVLAGHSENLLRRHREFTDTEPVPF